MKRSSEGRLKGPKKIQAGGTALSIGNVERRKGNRSRKRRERQE